jgi:hypothetical protein
MNVITKLPRTRLTTPQGGGLLDVLEDTAWKNIDLINPAQTSSIC